MLTKVTLSDQDIKKIIAEKLKVSEEDIEFSMDETTLRKLALKLNLYSDDCGEKEFNTL